jgi:hypothetical protein
MCSRADDDNKSRIVQLFDFHILYILTRFVDTVIANDGGCDILNAPAESTGRKRGYTNETNGLQVRPACLQLPSFFVSFPYLPDISTGPA